VRAYYSERRSGKETKISISDREWEAIQAGAITDTKLTQILRYADADSLKQRAMPRTSTQLSPTKVARIKTLAAAGYTNAQIAEAIGKSSSTVLKYISN
jgi:DNA-binding NarL/FixJ family response regulator